MYEIIKSRPTVCLAIRILPIVMIAQGVIYSASIEEIFSRITVFEAFEGFRALSFHSLMENQCFVNWYFCYDCERVTHIPNIVWVM